MLFFCLQCLSLAVLPSLGLGSLSAREAEGRRNISTGDKVHIFYIKLFFYLDLCILKIRSFSISLFYQQHNFPLSKNITVNILW
jgi:hypothetical protein